MARLFLVHWNEAEAEERAEFLRGAGHEVRVHWNSDDSSLAPLRNDPPDAVILDLRRLPSQGRGWATAMRQGKKTRHIPLVFVEGDPEKTARTREALPDATFTPWSRIRSAVKKAASDGVSSKPVVPGTMDGYAGTPLPKKLGIRAGKSVSLLHAPKGFEKTLGTLPEGCVLRKTARGTSDVVLLFVRGQAELKQRWSIGAKLVAEGGRLWVVWPKKTSALAGDLGGNEVRAFGLAKKWVDFKIAAVDADWSGLCFSRRK